MDENEKRKWMDENEKRNGWMKMKREGGIGMMFRSYILHIMEDGLGGGEG